MKIDKTPGSDEIMTEQIKQFGTKIKQWLLKIKYLRTSRKKTYRRTSRF